MVAIINSKKLDFARSIIKKEKIFTINKLVSILECSSRTAQAKLKLWKTYTSYNQNGKYYALPEIPHFNDYGLWRFKKVGFSKHGNLKKTIVYLVSSAPDGLTGRQIGEAPLKYISYIGTLGLDEIALKKGHRDFVVIVSSRYKGNTRLIEVLPDRKKATVLAFLNTIPNELQETIEDVATDMYEGYLSVVTESLGEKMEIVIDRFHVSQAYRKGADNLRKKEQKRLKKELDESDYKELQGLL